MARPGTERSRIRRDWHPGGLPCSGLLHVPAGRGEGFEGTSLSRRRTPGHRAFAPRVTPALLTQHPALADLEESARRLDQYYVPTRYPNGLPGGTPADAFSKAQATEALARAKRFVEIAGALIG